MIKNQKMRTMLTVVISLVTVVCIALLYFFAQAGMTGLMKKSAIENMKASLKARTVLIEEYVKSQEKVIGDYSTNSLVIDCLQNVSNQQRQMMRAMRCQLKELLNAFQVLNKSLILRQFCS